MAERSSAPTTIQCEARVRTIGRSTIVILPDEASAELPSRGQVAVAGALNGKPFDAVLEPDGRRGHWLKVGKKLSSALDDGETVQLELEPVEDWPEPSLPKDFRTALSELPDASELWEQITPMARWEWVRWINSTKNPETRDRRVTVGISKLRSGKRRPCCFDLSSCTDPDLAKNGKLVE